MGGERVLLVSGDGGDAERLASWLAEAGYEVLRAAQPEAVDPTGVAAEVALVVVAWDTSPGASAGLCRTLRATLSPARPKILVVSREGNPAARDEALAAGADDYLAAPPSAGVLQGHVTTLLRARATERALSRRGDRLRAAVHQVVLALAGQTDRQQVLELVTARACELVEGTVAGVALLEPASGLARSAACWGPLPREAREVVRPGEGVAGRALATGRPVVENDYQRSALATPGYRAAGARAVVAVPLLVRGEVVGVLSVADYTGARRFDREDVEVLSLLASHAALAIERAELLAAVAERAQQAEETRERLQALATLADARASQLEAVLEQMADAVIVVDADAKVARVNRAAETLLGTRREALVGRAYRLDSRARGPRGERLGRAEHAVEQAIRTGRVTVEREYWYRFDHAERLLSVSAAPVLVDGRRAGTVAVFRDVTERQRLESQLAAAEKLRALGELAAGAAHNFNNTLAAIMSRAELMAQAVDQPELRESLDHILRAAEDGAAMVRRIQAFARQGTLSPPTAVDVESLLREAVAVAEPRWRDQAQRRGALIEVHLDLQPVPTVLGDPGELREVLVNLVNNAADALPTGGRIVLSARRVDDLVELRVEDNGVGIQPELQAQIFEPFWTTKGSEGTGLGLAVSHGIVARHGGTMGVESTPGSGTTMWVRLLAAESAAVEPAASPPAAPVAVSARLLVVDDNVKLAGMLAQVLRLDGHTVDCCSSGQEALAACAATRYDLVLTDVGMPGMSGLELARALTAAQPDVPVGLVTGWGNALDPDERAASGARFVLSKPYLLDEVRTVVANTLAEARLARREA